MTLRDKLSSAPEHALILQAARPFPDASAQQRLRELAGEVGDWLPILQEAEKTKVLPLVGRNLTEAAGDLLPPDAADYLSQRVRAHALHNLARVAELVRLVRRFNEAGIQVLPLKGPVLSQALYGNVSLRQFSDLDVLVPPDGFAQAVGMVLADGYRQYRPAQVLQPDQIEALLRHFDDYHFGFFHSRRRVQLEVHWDLVRHMPAEAFRSLPLDGVVLGGERLPLLAPEALLLYLCLHGSKDYWHRLSWVCDVAAFVEAFPEVDAEAVWRRAVRYGAAMRLCLGLFLAQELLGTRLPEPLRLHVERRRPVLERAAAMCPLMDPRPVDVPQGVYLRYQSLTRERLRDRLHFYGQYLFGPKHWVLEEEGAPALPARLFALYYLRRVGHLVFRHAMRPFHRAG